MLAHPILQAHGIRCADIQHAIRSCDFVNVILTGRGVVHIVRIYLAL